MNTQFTPSEIQSELMGRAEAISERDEAMQAMTAEIARLTRALREMTKIAIDNGHEVDASRAEDRETIERILGQREVLKLELHTMTEQRDAAWAAQADLVETRIALQNSEACRAQAEQDALSARQYLSQRDAARQDAERLAKALNTIAWEPIGRSEATHPEVYEDILVIAKAALAAHAVTK